MDGIVGEIRAFAFGYCPECWLPCDGSIVSVQAYTALYSIIGNGFGGTANSTFALPDLRSYTIIGAGQGTGLTNRFLWSKVGSSSVLLSNSQLPMHDHNVNGYIGLTDDKFVEVPSSSSYLSNMFSKNGTAKTSLFGYVDPQSNPVILKSESVSAVGSTPNTPHENRSPFLTACYCICYEGVYPVRQ